MSKYDKMVANNQAASREKIDCARKAILLLLEEDRQVTVCELVKRTGLSRGFFYKNPEISKELDRARERQHGRVFVKPQKAILDKAIDNQLQVLQQQIMKLKKENETLKAENQKLEKALKKKDLAFIKSL